MWIYRSKLGLLKAEVIHGLSSLLMGVICPLMLITVFPSAVQEENVWDIAKSVIPYALITYPLLYRSWIPDRNVITFPRR